MTDKRYDLPLTTKQAAAYINRSIQTFRNMKYRGDITPMGKLGKSDLWDREELDRAIQVYLLRDGISVAKWDDSITAYYEGGRVLSKHHVSGGFYTLLIEMEDGTRELRKNVHGNKMMMRGD